MSNNVRRSMFLEGRMDEFTPANSIEEGLPGRRWRRDVLWWYWTEGRGKVVLRLLNAVLHLAVCCVVLTIMAQFLALHRGHRRRPQAIALTTLVAVDCCVDLYGAYLLAKQFPGWAMILRLSLSLGYIAQFFLYVAFRKVFPPGYSYWGMDQVYSDPVLYMLIWIVGIWDLFHTTIHRHTLGRFVRGLCLQGRREAGAQGGGRSTVNQLPRTRPSVLRRARSPARGQERQSDSGVTDVTIALSEVRIDDKGPDMAATSESGLSSTFGESSSQAGTSVRADSKSVSAVASRSTSAIFSDETAEAGSEADSAGRIESRHRTH